MTKKITISLEDKVYQYIQAKTNNRSAYIGIAEQIDNVEVTKVTEILSAEKSEGKGRKSSKIG